MHILFVHQNFPAQFGHIAEYLIKQKGFRCTFVSQMSPGTWAGVERIQYQVKSGATDKTHYCSRSFENATWHSHALYEALHLRPDIQPDLVVAHSGFLTTAFLRELYRCPMINYFEYYYRTQHSDMDFRPDFPSPQINKLRARARNAVLLLDLENCDAAYSPTEWQKNRFPKMFHDKIEVVFDGIDTNIWKPRPGQPRRIGNRLVPDDIKLVTYVSRGMESMRGFDIFMKTANLLCKRRQDVLFVVVGQDRICYGGDKDVTGKLTFKEYVLSGDQYDLSRFVFTGLMPIQPLAELLAVSDLHIYLTVPFVLSWSLMDALACGATVLASNTAPVQEMIQHGHNGLLVDFFDVEGFATQASRVLDAPGEFKALGSAGTQMIREHYSLEVCLPRMLALYEKATAAYHTRGQGVNAFE
jgi:glycosyltransferase involved in cell wall biosynthesis